MDSRKAIIHGTVNFMYSDSDSEHCICCPNGRHAYSRSVVLDDFKTSYPEHFGRNADIFLKEFAAKHEHVGKRVKITVEILED